MIDNVSFPNDTHVYKRNGIQDIFDLENRFPNLKSNIIDKEQIIERKNCIFAR